LEANFGGSGNPAYPGGGLFNLFNLGKTEEEMKTLKLKEIKNGRLVSARAAPKKARSADLPRPSPCEPARPVHAPRDADHGLDERCHSLAPTPTHPPHPPN
jgi:hypothetical protein